MKVFTENLFSIWGNPFLPIDHLHAFDGSEWLISITNFLNSDIIGIAQPIVIRKPIPALFNSTSSFIIFGESLELQWIFENVRMSWHPTYNFSNAPEYQSEICSEPGGYATFNLKKVILGSKLWNPQLEMDLFPPYVASGWLTSSINRLVFIFTWSKRFLYPWLRKMTAMDSSLNNVISGEIPVLQTFLFPQKFLKSFETTNVVEAWIHNREYKPMLETINVHSFLVGSVESANQTYSPDKIVYVDQRTKEYVVEVTLEPLCPHGIFSFLSRVWRSQMFWKISANIKEVKEYFEKCDNLAKHFREPKSITLSAEGILNQAVVNMWQSMFKNYTYPALEGLVCSNGRNIQDNSKWSSYSELVIGGVHLRPFWHIPLQVLNPANGSYRFVVCGLRGTEGMAFGELVKVYDAYIWGNLLIFIGLLDQVWKRLMQLSQDNSDTNTVGSKLISLVKILLEQGCATKDCCETSSTKVRAFLGVTLIMSIVLSNGYKNANVHKMILPRRQLRYEHFIDLIEDNFSIYTFSTPEPISLLELVFDNWFLQNVSVSRISHHKIL